MKISFPFLIAALIANSCVTGSARSEISVLGSVAKPAEYATDGKDADLSSLIEAAGGILATGSDKICITSPLPDGQSIMKSIKGSDLYSGDCDYIVPQDSKVIVWQCVGLGFGNLSASEFVELERKRGLYIQKKADGKIHSKELFEKPKEANKALEPTPTAVTDRASARSAPVTGAAHL